MTIMADCFIRVILPSLIDHNSVDDPAFAVRFVEVMKMASVTFPQLLPQGSEGSKNEKVA